MILLLVSLHRIVEVSLLGIKCIYVTELEETQVSTLAVHIVLYALKSTEQQCLAHHVQVGTQWIHNLYAVLGSVGITSLVVSTLGERVVQDFVESLAYQLLAYDVSQLMLLVLIALNHEASLQLGWNLYIIISVDTQDILYYIARTGNVHTVSRNLQLQALGSLLEHLHLQTLTDSLDLIGRNLLTNQAVNILI